MRPMLNGSHDVGGSRVFGAVPMDAHGTGLEPWQGAVIGTVFGMLMAGICRIEQLRAGIEQLTPLAYLRLGYWERWLQSIERALVANGTVTRAEIAARVDEVAGNPDAALPAPVRADAGVAARVDALIAQGPPIPDGADELTPGFGLGDRVRARVIAVTAGAEHTRLPGYVQGKAGTIDRVYPPFLVPDLRLKDLDRPEYVYAVRFAGRELWPDSDDGQTVSADLWESYLEAA